MYTSVDIASEVMKVTDGKGCKLVIDGIEKMIYANGDDPAFFVLYLLPQSTFMTRPKLNDYAATKKELE